MILLLLLLLLLLMIIITIILRILVIAIERILARFGNEAICGLALTYHLVMHPLVSMFMCYDFIIMIIESFITTWITKIDS